MSMCDFNVTFNLAVANNSTKCFSDSNISHLSQFLRNLSALTLHTHLTESEFGFLTA